MIESETLRIQGELIGDVLSKQELVELWGEGGTCPPSYIGIIRMCPCCAGCGGNVDGYCTPQQQATANGCEKISKCLLYCNTLPCGNVSLSQGAGAATVQTSSPTHVTGQIYLEQDPILDDIQITLDNNNPVNFTWNSGAMRFDAHAGVFATLTDIGATPPLGPWQMTTEQGDVYVFQGLGANALGEATRIAYRSGRTTYFYYDTAERIFAVDPTEGVLTYYEYPDASDTKPNKVYESGPIAQGRVSYFGYDSTQVNKIVRKYPNGCQTLNAYNSGLADRILDPEGYTTYFFYSPTRLTKTIRGGLVLQQYVYNGTTSTGTADGLNRPTYYEYDVTGVPASIIDGLGNTTQQRYDNYLRTQVNTPRGYLTYYQYDSLGNQIRMVDPLIEETQAKYSSNSELLRTQDALSRVTYYEYNSQGLRTARMDALNNKIQMAYDTAGDMIRVQDPLLNVTYFDYDSYSRQTQMVDALNNITGYEYLPNFDNAAGLRKSTLDARSFRTYFEYDAADQLQRMVNGVGDPHDYDYNSCGKMSAQYVKQDSSNAAIAWVTTYYTYDGQNSLLKTIRKLGSSDLTDQTVYDAGGLPDHTYNARGYSTYFIFDNARRRNRVIDALQNVTYFGYDADSNVTKVADARMNGSYFEYDELDRQKKTVDALGGTTLTGYDAVGNTVRMVDKRSNTTYYEYDAIYRRTKTIDALNNQTYFGYDVGSNVVKQLDPLLNVTYFEYDKLNRRFKAIDAAKQLTYFGYDQVGNLVKVTDARLATTYYQYDGINRQSGVHRQAAISTFMGWDAAGNLLRTRDPRAFTTYYQYDQVNRRVLQIDQLGKRTYFAYDSNSNLTRTQDALAHTTYFEYDALDRRSKTIDALNNQTYFGYDEVGNQVKVFDARSNTTYFGYDALNRRAQTIDAQGSLMLYGYDANNNLLRSVDMRSNTTYFEYDALNRRNKSIDALNFVTTMGYDADSNLTKTLDPLSHATYFNYDPLNRRARVLDATGASTYFGYDSGNNLTKTLDARKNATYFGYDNADRRTKIMDALGNSTYFKYDANSNLTTLSDPLRNVTYFEYSKRNELKKVLEATSGSTYFAYDDVGNRLFVWDPLSHATYFQYDPLNRTSKVLAADAGEVSFGYDANSNRTAEMDPLLHTTYYQYDSLNRVKKLIDPLKKEVTYAYDQNSNLTRRLDQQSNASYFAYDKRNSLITKFYSDAAVAYYEYDGDANVNKLIDAWGTHTYSYDPVNRLTRHEFPSTTGAAYFGYDAVGNLTRLQYLKTLNAAYFGYDSVNRLTKVLASTSTLTYYEYDKASNCTLKILGNNVQGAMTYDVANRVSAIRYNDAGAAITYFEYDRNLKGMVKTIVRPEHPYTIYYTYDSVDRLKTENWYSSVGGTAVYAFEYAYDKAGNRTHSNDSRDGEWTYYAYDNDNSLTKYGRNTSGKGVYFTYDSTGSCTKIFNISGTTYFEYTAANMVKSCLILGSTQTKFDYDGNLQRYRITTDGTNKYYLWDGLRLLEIRDNSNTLLMRFAYGYTTIPGIGDCIEAYDGTTKYYLLGDQRGSIVKVLDGAKTVTATREYNANGEVLWSTGSWPTNLPFRYQSDYLYLVSLPGSVDSVLSQARVYIPKLGRYLQRDPLGNKAGYNQYAYCKMNPIRGLDALGRKLCIEGVDITKESDYYKNAVSADPKYKGILDAYIDSSINYVVGTGCKGEQSVDLGSSAAFNLRINLNKNLEDVLASGMFEGALFPTTARPEGPKGPVGARTAGNRVPGWDEKTKFRVETNGVLTPIYGIQSDTNNYTPSDALDQLLQAIKEVGEKWKDADEAGRKVMKEDPNIKVRLDCGTMSILTWYVALRNTIGADLFNQMFPGGIFFGGVINTAPGNSDPLKKPTIIDTIEIEKAGTLPGDILHWNNPGCDLEKYPNWGGENIIKTVSDFWIPGRSYKTEEELKAELKTMRIPDSIKEPERLPSALRIAAARLLDLLKVKDPKIESKSVCSNPTPNGIPNGK